MPIDYNSFGIPTYKPGQTPDFSTTVPKFLQQSSLSSSSPMGIQSQPMPGQQSSLGKGGGNPGSFGGINQVPGVSPVGLPPGPGSLPSQPGVISSPGNAVPGVTGGISPTLTGGMQNLAPLPAGAENWGSAHPAALARAQANQAALPAGQAYVNTPWAAGWQDKSWQNDPNAVAQARAYFQNNPVIQALIKRGNGMG